MAATANARSEHISEIRRAATKIWEGIEDLNTARGRWDAGFNAWVVDANGDDPAAEDFVPGDFHGVNEGLRTADLTLVLSSTLTALNALLSDGHGTNLLKTRM